MSPSIRRRSAVLAAALSALGTFVIPARAQVSPNETWTDLAPSPSLPQSAAMASAYDPVSGHVIVFGGYDANVYLNTTWSFDGQAWTQVATPVAPSARAAARMAYDAVTQKLVLFGGYNGKYLGDTWLFDGATSTWTPVHPAASPVAVTGPMLFTDPVNGHVVEYGGYNGMFYQLDTWRWTGTTWQNLAPATAPSARAAATVALDPVNHQVVLFGGLASVNPWNTWTWDGTNWTLESPSQQPALRYDGAAAYDPHLAGVVVFGGGSGGVDLNDTWLWTGNDWQPVPTVQSPPARESFAMAYDEAIGRIVVAGGEDPALGALYGDTASLVDPGAFVHGGTGIAGSLGAPTLDGSGDLSPGSAYGFTLEVGNTLPFNPVLLFVGQTSGNVPLLGGTLYPFPIQLAVTLPTDGTGHVALSTSVPAIVPSGSSFVMQAWMPDASAPQQAAATDGVLAVVP